MLLTIRQQLIHLVARQCMAIHFLQYPAAQSRRAPTSVVVTTGMIPWGIIAHMKSPSNLLSRRLVVDRIQLTS